jgi:hypothetical protein
MPNLNVGAVPAFAMYQHLLVNSPNKLLFWVTSPLAWLDQLALLRRC